MVTTISECMFIQLFSSSESTFYLYLGKSHCHFANRLISDMRLSNGIYYTVVLNNNQKKPYIANQVILVFKTMFRSEF